MEEAFRRSRSVEISENSCADDPNAIASDRDRYGQNDQRDARPASSLSQISVANRQSEQRHQRTDAAASFNHFQRVIRQDQ